MDDVLIVVGLLVFGSSLFCLCCYKVSKLLYMLYHIDDAESSTGDISTAAVTTANAALAVAAPTKVSLSPEEKVGAVKNNGTVLTGINSHFVNQQHVPTVKQVHHQQASPGVVGASTSMLTLVPSSSTNSLTHENKNLHKAGANLNYD